MNIDDEAAKRTRLHDGQRSQAPGAAELDRVGLRGEVAFGELTGLAPNLKTYGGAGDDGYDFAVPCLVEGRRRILTIDVKTFRNPISMLVIEGTVKASLYVMADGSSDERIHFMGYAWRREVLDAPVSDPCRTGIRNHQLFPTELHPMAKLFDFIARVSASETRAP